jgi:hypothetical protein
LKLSLLLLLMSIPQLDLVPDRPLSRSREDQRGCRCVLDGDADLAYTG